MTLFCAQQVETFTHFSLFEQPDDQRLFSATEIVEYIAARKWTASQVLDAYMARAVVSQMKTNCITEGQSDANGVFSDVNYSLVHPSSLRRCKETGKKS